MGPKIHWNKAQFSRVEATEALSLTTWKSSSTSTWTGGICRTRPGGWRTDPGTTAQTSGSSAGSTWHEAREYQVRFFYTQIGHFVIVIVIVLLFYPGRGNERTRPRWTRSSVSTDRPTCIPSWPCPTTRSHLSRPADAQHQEAGLPPPPVHGPPGQRQDHGAAGRSQHRLHLHHLLHQDVLVLV